MFRFSIRSSTARLVVFISTVIVAIIIIFQLIWLKKVYRFEQKGFDTSVLKAIRGLYEDLEINIYNSYNLSDLVERPEEHLYLARINLPVNKDSLKTYLQYELEDFDVFTNCIAGVYQANNNNYSITDTLFAAGSHEKASSMPPAITKDYDYLALYFPNRQKYIINQMNFWFVSSIILLIMLIVSAGSLYFFYRQKNLNEIQKDFVQNFTHEFKTPVATIALAAETIDNKNIIDKPGKLSTYTDIIRYQSGYLGKQIEKLLKYAHIESGNLHLAKDQVNLHDLINEALTNITPLITQKNAEVRLQLEAARDWLEADRDYLIIMLTNLIENALKYSKHPSILITTSNNVDNIVLSVIDNGVGIERKQIKKLFRKFYRIRNKEEQPARGFGIGLTFVKKIIDAHKGRITVESVPGSGSVFTIELPITNIVYHEKVNGTIS